MKGKLKKYDYLLYWLIITLIVALNIVLLFMPDILSNKYSYKDLQQKEIDIESTNSQIKINEQDLIYKQEELSRIKQQGTDAEIQEQHLRQHIDFERIKLHIPSILIDLEQKALSDGVTLKILYDLKTNTGYNGGGNMGEPVEGVIEDPMMVPVESNSIENIQTGLETESSSANIQQIMSKVNFPYIEGLNNTSIPIEVEGEYHKIAKYLKYLDEIDYIDPVYVEINSEGQTMKGLILVNILHY